MQAGGQGSETYILSVCRMYIYIHTHYVCTMSYKTRAHNSVNKGQNWQ